MGRDPAFRVAGCEGPLVEGFRMVLVMPFDATYLVIEAEWQGGAGLLSSGCVPAAQVYHATVGEPFERHELNVCELVVDDALHAAIALALDVEDPPDRWNGRDGHWAAIQIWRDGGQVHSLGRTWPLDHEPELRRVALALLGVVAPDKPGDCQAIAIWRERLLVM